MSWRLDWTMHLGPHQRVERNRGDIGQGRGLQPPPLRRDPDDGGVGGPLREQVDLDALSAELLAVVEQTVQPTQAWLWLRPSQAPPGTAGAAMARQRT
jgi:hypothetical protein